MKISATVQFHNELEFLPGWFQSAKKYADEIICGSHNSMDGSLEYVKEQSATSEIPITVIEFPQDTVYRHGFSFIKNALIEKATGDWIVSLDADEEMQIDRNTFGPLTQRCTGISTQTMHIAYKEPQWTLDNRQQIIDEAKWEQQRHWRVFRNGFGIKWHGLIHESLRFNGLHISTVSKNTVIKMYHFGALANAEKRTFKDGLYAELLLRAEENMDLRYGTDKWWFDTFIPQNREKLVKDRNEYRKTITAS